MIRKLIIISAVILLAGCAGFNMKPEETAASKTIPQLSAVGSAPSESNQLVIDQSGVSKSITVLNLMKSLENALTSYAIENDNLDNSIIKGGASCYFENGGSALESNDQCRFRVPFDHTLQKVILTTDDDSGIIDVDVWIAQAGSATGLDDVTSADSIFDTYQTANGYDPRINASSDQYAEYTYSGGDFDSGTQTRTAGDYYIVNLTVNTSGILKLNVDFEWDKRD